MSDRDLVADVEAYLNDNRAEVERVAKAFADAGGEPTDLDDLVADLGGDYGADAANEEEDEDEQELAIAHFEAEATSINDRGVELQVAAILMGKGIEEGEELIMSEAGSSPTP